MTRSRASLLGDYVDDVRAGRWRDRRTPKRGWSLIEVDDFEEPTFTCEMCETAKVRYVHYVQHPRFPDILRVGCICCGYMIEDHGAALRAETACKNLSRRRVNFPGLKRWSVREAHNGATYHAIKCDGFRVNIFKNAGGFRPSISRGEGWRQGKSSASLHKAMRRAFDMIQTERHK